MKSIKGTILIATLVCGVLVCPCLAKAGPSVRGKRNPTAMALLDKFAETADKTHTSFITKSRCKIVSEHKYSGEWEYLNGTRTKHFLQEFRTDGERIKYIKQKWGDFIGPDGICVYRPESEKDYGSDTYNGEKAYDYGGPHNSPGRLSIIRKEPEKAFPINIMLAYDNHVSESFGYLHGDIERIDRILKKTGTGRVSVRDKMEDLNGIAHYVIDAKTNRGQYTIWFNPEKGYNLSKAVVVREAGNFWMTDIRIEPECKKRYHIENTKFTEVDGVWVPLEAKMRIHDTLPGGDYVKFTRDVELTSILINPDHDALDSFSIDDIKDGARILFRDGTPGDYIWRDGKIVDEKGREVDYKAKAKENKADKSVSDANDLSEVETETQSESSGINASQLLAKYRATRDILRTYSAEGQKLIEENDRKEKTASKLGSDAANL
jgi:hypothetical protein